MEKIQFKVRVEEYTQRGQNGWGIWFGSNTDKPDFFILDLNELQHIVNLHWKNVQMFRTMIKKEA